MLELPNKNNEEHHNKVDIIEDNNEEINSSTIQIAGAAIAMGLVNHH